MGTMNALPMTKSQCRQTYLDQKSQSYDKIVIGAVIFSKGSQEPRKVLLLKRAAHEEHYANIYKISGGRVEDTDSAIPDAVKREVLEETGLWIEKLLGQSSLSATG